MLGIKYFWIWDSPEPNWLFSVYVYYNCHVGTDIYDARFIFRLQLMRNWVPRSCMELSSWVKDGDPMDPDSGKRLIPSSYFIRNQKMWGDQVLLTIPFAQCCPGSGRNFHTSWRSQSIIHKKFGQFCCTMSCHKAQAWMQLKGEK